MLEPVSQRTYDRIERLTREAHVAGEQFAYCPCRVLPETVLNLKAMLHEVDRLWRETLGDGPWNRLRADPEGARFLAGEVRLVEVQEGRPDMVGVWLPVPPDYPRRLKVQLVDALEPWEMP